MSCNPINQRPIWQWGAAETALAIRSRSVSCVEAVRAAVTRMRAANTLANAVTVDLGDQALVEAEQADVSLLSGAPIGPLHGVPITIKENIDQRGQATTNGLPGLASLTAAEDAPAVSNLRRSGAIVIGRTNTPEFSLRYFTDNPLRGVTRNPWHARLTSGGSSGGAAAAVALGIGSIAHGSDLAGSLRYPAYCCGVTTIRPSFGRVPAYNPSQTIDRPPLIQMMTVQGPIARCVSDLRLALQVMAKGDSRDPWWVPAPLEYLPDPAPVRVAVCFGDGEQRCSAAVSTAIRAAADHLDKAGYAVEECQPPSSRGSMAYNLLWTEVTTMLGESIRQLGSSDFHSIIAAYCQAAPPLEFQRYMAGLAARASFCRRWNEFLERYPLLLCPVSLAEPFDINEDLKGSGRVAEIFSAQSMLVAVGFAGLPSVAAPVGVSAGVPTGVQIVSQRFREDRCLQAAQVLEDAIGAPIQTLLRSI